MTILSKVISKVKTLIEYAKFGVFMIRVNNYDNKNDRLMPLHFPKGVYKFDSDLIQYATALTGHLTVLGGRNYYAMDNTTIEYINLPNAIPMGWGTCKGMKALKECHLHSWRDINSERFYFCGNLEVFEVGSLTAFDIQVLKESAKLHTFICGKDTNCSLYLQYCPLLTQECLHNIIDNLADRTGTSALTLYVHQEAYDRISEEYKTKLSNKNWNLAVA